MASMSTKNLPLTGAAADLGLGDNLTQQVQDNLANARIKRRLTGQNPRGMAAQALGLAPLTGTGMVNALGAWGQGA